MKKMYFIFTILIILIFSYDFSFADGEVLTLPIGPQTFVDAGVPANSKLFVFSGPSLFDYTFDGFTSPKSSPVVFYVFFRDNEPAFNDYSKSYEYSMYSYNSGQEPFAVTSCFRTPNSLPAYLNGKRMSNSSGGFSFIGYITPSVYYFDGENVTLVDGEDVNNSLGESFRKGDEMILFEKPKDNSFVFSKRNLMVISLSNLKFKGQWFTFGNNWGKRLKNSGYDVRFSIDGKDVDYLSGDKNVIYTKVPSANVLHLSFDQDFKDGEKYVLKVELFKDGESIAWHRISVVCQSTFTDADGDGYDDITGVQLPGKFPSSISSITDFFKFIFALFSAILNAIKETTKLLKDFVHSSADFAKVLVSIFSVNSTISAIFVLSLSVAVLLRILKR